VASSPFGEHDIGEQVGDGADQEAEHGGSKTTLGLSLVHQVERERGDQHSCSEGHDRGHDSLWDLDQPGHQRPHDEGASRS
jgi:hypothetical protein